MQDLPMETQIKSNKPVCDARSDACVVFHWMLRTTLFSYHSPLRESSDVLTRNLLLLICSFSTSLGALSVFIS